MSGNFCVVVNVGDNITTLFEILDSYDLVGDLVEAAISADPDPIFDLVSGQAPGRYYVSGELVLSEEDGYWVDGDTVEIHRTNKR